MTTLTPKDRWGAVLLGLSAVVLVAVAILCGVLGTPPADAPENQRPVSTACTVLLDGTDRFTLFQREALAVRLRALSRSLREGDVLTLYGLGLYPEGSLRRLFCGRVPQREAQPLWQNPRLVTARFDSLLARPLEEAVAAASHARPAPRSPILAGVTTLAEELQSTGASHHQLVLISDLLENEPAVSHYRRSPSFAAFTTSPARAHLQADLRGVDVEVWQLTRARDEARQGQALRRFWEAYLRAAGARSVHITLL